jgi:hypothetical protein
VGIDRYDTLPTLKHAVKSVRAVGELAWSPHNDFIYGEDLGAAVLEEWPESADGQHPPHSRRRRPDWINAEGLHAQQQHLAAHPDGETLVQILVAVQRPQLFPQILHTIACKPTAGKLLRHATRLAGE